MSEVKSTIQAEISIILTNLNQLSLVKERERAEAAVNYKRVLENGVGVLLNLGLQPSILLNERDRRGITSYSAVYRRGDTVKFHEFNGQTSISDSNADWNILLVPHPSYPEIYLATEGQLVFFPEESLMEETDFLEVYYRTASYHGILRVTCYDGTQNVFSEINANQYGQLYRELVDELSSLAVDINALQSLNSMARFDSLPDDEQIGVRNEW